MASTLNFYHCSERSIFNKQKVSYSKNNNQYIRYEEKNTDGTYEPVLGTPDILWHSCVFIDDTKEIWCMGVFYCGGNIVSAGQPTTGTAFGELTEIHNEINKLKECTEYFDIEIHPHNVKLWKDEYEEFVIPVYSFDDNTNYVYTYDAPELLGKLYSWYSVLQKIDEIPLKSFYIRLKFYCINNSLYITKLVSLIDVRELDFIAASASYKKFARNVHSETFDLPFQPGKRAYIEFLEGGNVLRVREVKNESTIANIDELSNYFIRKDTSVEYNNGYSAISGQLSINLYESYPSENAYKYQTDLPGFSLTNSTGCHTVISRAGIQTEKLAIYEQVHRNSSRDTSYGARYTEITSSELTTTNIRIPLIPEGREIGSYNYNTIGKTFGLTIGDINDSDPVVKISLDGIKAPALSIGNIKITDNLLSLSTAVTESGNNYNERCLLLLRCPENKETGKYKLSCYQRSTKDLISQIELNLVKTSLHDKIQYDLFVSLPIMIHANSNIQHRYQNHFFNSMHLYVYSGALAFYWDNIKDCLYVEYGDYDIVIEPDDLDKEAYTLEYLGDYFTNELVAAALNYSGIKINNAILYVPTAEFSLQYTNVQDEIIHLTATYDPNESDGLRRMYTNWSNKTKLYYSTTNPRDSSISLEIYPMQYYQSTPEKFIYQVLPDLTTGFSNLVVVNLQVLDDIMPGNTLEIYLILPVICSCYDIQTWLNNTILNSSIINNTTGYIPVIGNYDNLTSENSTNIICNGMKLDLLFKDPWNLNDYKCAKITMSCMDCQLTASSDYPYANKIFYTYNFEELGPYSTSKFLKVD